MDTQTFHAWDETPLKRAIELSTSYRTHPDHTPFGATVAINGAIIGEGISEVVARRDPSAHAEVLAIQQACHNQGAHLLPTATLYCSSFPCPLCLSLARWAQIERIIYAGHLTDTHQVGFEDEQFYTDLQAGVKELPTTLIPANQAHRGTAVDALNGWKHAHG